MFRYVVSVLVFAISLLFVGCASSYEMWVSVSDGKGDYSISGSIRNIEQRYTIFFVSTHDGYYLNMGYLAEIAQKKGAFDILLQVFCYWENDVEFRIDYIFQDNAGRYLCSF